MAPPTDHQDLKEVMNNLNTGSSPIIISATLPRTLEMLATLVESIDFFVHFCSIIFLVDFGSESQPPLFPGEAFESDVLYYAFSSTSSSSTNPKPPMRLFRTETGKVARFKSIIFGLGSKAWRLKSASASTSCYPTSFRVYVRSLHLINQSPAVFRKLRSLPSEVYHYFNKPIPPFLSRL